ncbi:MAG: hypothetical protein ACRD6U_04020 [Nitrososphaeraceae archaeon]
MEKHSFIVYISNSLDVLGSFKLQIIRFSLIGIVISQMKAGEGADLLVGGNGDDELYGGTGDDVSIGGKGVNFFDCGDGNDIIVDFDPDKGDTQSGNCEVILNNHGDMNIFTQPNKIQSQLKAFGIGSLKG